MSVTNCDGRFTHKVHLTTCKKSKHEGIKYYCDQCDGSFTQKSNLITQMKNKHEGIMYFCNQCDGSYNMQKLQTSITLHK